MWKPWGRKATGPAGPSASQEAADALAQIAEKLDYLSDIYDVLTDVRDEVRGLRDDITADRIPEQIRDGIDKMADGLADDLGAIRERLNVARFDENEVGL